MEQVRGKLLTTTCEDKTSLEVGLQGFVSLIQVVLGSNLRGESFDFVGDGLIKSRQKFPLLMPLLRCIRFKVDAHGLKSFILYVNIFWVTSTNTVWCFCKH
jgi:hypothetical protein